MIEGITSIASTVAKSQTVANFFNQNNNTDSNGNKGILSVLNNILSTQTNVQGTLKGRGVNSNVTSSSFVSGANSKNLATVIPEGFLLLYNELRNLNGLTSKNNSSSGGLVSSVVGGLGKVLSGKLFTTGLTSALSSALPAIAPALGIAAGVVAAGAIAYGTYKYFDNKATKSGQKEVVAESTDTEGKSIHHSIDFWEDYGLDWRNIDHKNMEKYLTKIGDVQYLNAKTSKEKEEYLLQVMDKFQNQAMKVAIATDQNDKIGSKMTDFQYYGDYKEMMSLFEQAQNGGMTKEIWKTLSKNSAFSQIYGNLDDNLSDEEIQKRIANGDLKKVIESDENVKKAVEENERVQATVDKYNAGKWTSGDKYIDSESEMGDFLYKNNKDFKKSSIFKDGLTYDLQQKYKEIEDIRQDIALNNGQIENLDPEKIKKLGELENELYNDDTFKQAMFHYGANDERSKALYDSGVMSFFSRDARNGQSLSEQVSDETSSVVSSNTTEMTKVTQEQTDAQKNNTESMNRNTEASNRLADEIHDFNANKSNYSNTTNTTVINTTNGSGQQQSYSVQSYEG